MVNQTKQLVCPVCNANKFIIRYQATYVYSYLIDSDAPGSHNTEEFLPFMYDNREQQDTKQFLECRECGTKYDCYFNQWDKGKSLSDLQKAIDSSFSRS